MVSAPQYWGEEEGKRKKEGKGGGGSSFAAEGLLDPLAAAVIWVGTQVKKRKRKRGKKKKKGRKSRPKTQGSVILIKCIFDMIFTQKGRKKRTYSFITISSVLPELISSILGGKEKKKRGKKGKDPL